jgi:hypothetical protein
MVRCVRKVVRLGYLGYNKPMFTTRIAAFVLLAASACFGQTSGIIGSGTFPDSGITWATAPACANCLVISNGTWSGMQMETRKRPLHPVTLAQVRTAAHLLDRASLAPVAYASLASSLGVGASADDAQILAAIDSAGLMVYSFDKVDEYLFGKALAGGSNMRWVWKPLRQGDVMPLAAQNAIAYRTTAVGLVYPTLYGHEVPMRVLAEVKAILETVPDAVFLVSDYEVIKPDPFLAVSTSTLLNAGKIWVIDQWDEPGFGTVVPVGLETASNIHPD